MPALDTILQQKLALLGKKHLRRNISPSEREEGVYVTRAGRRLVSFSCNDYLGLSHHPDVIKAAQKALGDYGAGAGASRLVTGNHPLYDELEKALASYKHSEAACVFGSGYLANLGAIPALVGVGDLIVADKFIHACMYDAARLSGATFMRFAHNNMEHCRMILEANRAEHQNCLVLTETVFSMDGDRAPLSALYTLAEQFDAWIMVDDAHGCFTPSTIHYPPSTIQMGTLSKAMGSYGGYVCGSKTLIDYLKTSARSLIYSTAIPPATIAASIASLAIMKHDPELTKKPLEKAKLFCALLGMDVPQSAIVPVILKENDRAMAASALLEEKGFLVSAIRPPTVPEHTARLRFAFSALHRDEDIQAVARIIKSKGWV